MGDLVVNGLVEDIVTNVDAAGNRNRGGAINGGENGGVVANVADPENGGVIANVADAENGGGGDVVVGNKDGTVAVVENENVRIYSAVKERIDDDMEWDRIKEDMEFVREDGENEGDNGEEEVDAPDQEHSDDEDILRFENNYYMCNGFAGKDTACRGKTWKTKKGADNHVTKFH